MSPQQVFSIANIVALLSWITLAVFPGRPRATKIITVIVPSLFAVLYTAIAALLFWSAPGASPLSPGVGTLFLNPWLLLAGWVHYLAFDLLIGSWEVEDARERGIPHLIVIPCLVLNLHVRPGGVAALQDRAIRSGQRLKLTQSKG